MSTISQNKKKNKKQKIQKIRISTHFFLFLPRLSIPRQCCSHCWSPLLDFPQPLQCFLRGNPLLRTPVPTFAHQLRQLGRTAFRHLRPHSAHHGSEHFPVGEGGEWHPPVGEHLVQEHPKGPNVGLGREFAAGQALGGHPAGKIRKLILN